MASKLDKINEGIEKIEKYFITWSMIIMSAVIFIQVIMRYVFNNSLSWSEELTLFISTYMIWIAASYAIKKDAHLRITLFVDMFKGKPRIFVYLIIDIIWLAFSMGMIYLGEKMVRMSVLNNRVSPALEVPMWVIYASLIVGSLLMCLSLMIKIIEKVTALTYRG
jgi:TRAP-type C4-dicarboxylate transport system permease small subunit